MAFINEKISEADKDKIDMEEFWISQPHIKVRIQEEEKTGKSRNDLKKHWVKSSNFTKPSRWVIDRERDIYLIHLGGGGVDLPTSYGLYVQGEFVIFNVWEMAPGTTGNNKVGIDLFHKVSGLKIPQALESRRDEIKQLIRETLDLYGAFGNRTHVNSVTVEFTERRV